MKKYLILVLIILEYPLVLIAHKIEPTDMAGPGLDLIAIATVFFYDIFLVWTIIRDWSKSIFPKLYLIVFIISTYLLYHLIFIAPGRS
jgi:hypothetical protein